MSTPHTPHTPILSIGQRVAAIASSPRFAGQKITGKIKEIRDCYAWTAIDILCVGDHSGWVIVAEANDCKAIAKAGGAK